MRIAFLGCTKFSEELLISLMDLTSVKIVRIFSIPKSFKISYSDKEVVNTNYADLEVYAKKLDVPFHYINSGKDMKLADFENELKMDNLDLLLVLGWYYMIPKKIRDLTKYGAWGIHASLLPKFAGGAPLVWAMIEGEKETGVTLFRMEDGVDDGDIIEQDSFTIEKSDTIREVYDKATKTSKNILSKVFSTGYQLMFKPQDKSKIKIYPQRKPDDGEIDWSKSPEEIERFIKAQTKPYPGAWTIINGKKITIWDSKIQNDENL